MGRSAAIITISGLDGSGKSSNASKLVQRLKKEGVDCKYLWTGWKSSVSFPFLGLMRLLGLTNRVRIQGKTFVIWNYSHVRPLKALWPYLLFLDYVVNCVIRVRYTRLSGNTVVCDRYMHDLLAMLLQDDNCPSVILRLAARVFPTPTISFLFDIGERTSWKRTLSGERVIEQPFYNVHTRRNIYLDLARTHDMVVINAEDDPELVGEQVARNVLTKLAELGRN